MKSSFSFAKLFDHFYAPKLFDHVFTKLQALSTRACQIKPKILSISSPNPAQTRPKNPGLDLKTLTMGLSNF